MSVYCITMYLLPVMLPIIYITVRTIIRGTEHPSKATIVISQPANLFKAEYCSNYLQGNYFIINK